MLSSVLRYFLGVVIGAAIVCCIFVGPAGAQTRQDQAIAQFLANPSQVLQRYPNGGPRMISLIRDAAVAHPEALQTIIGLLNGANADQQSAIGSALGQAANIVVKTNQAYANQIQQAIANSGSGDANTSFAAVTGNVNIGSTGGGGGGGGGSGSIGFGIPTGGSNTGTGTVFGTSHYATSTQNFFTSSGTSGATSNGTTSSRSVSPH
jgi:hypothetical protein